METPKYYEFMNPILQALREGGGTLTNEEIVDAVVTCMQLPDGVLKRQQHGHNLGAVEIGLPVRVLCQGCEMDYESGELIP